ncbi:MAG: translocation/assembly module TamB, partial [Candidatus Symbiothrix sp.]|nr:translocation/assembly module TamB [Candidatus Symbiothrix sp.]
ALYRLRADLTTLDPSFASILVNPSVPVDCSLSASGNINDIKLKYNILLPNESDDTQRQVNSLLYSDDMKIKEIAYLLAFGAFLPLRDNLADAGNSNLVNSLAALSSGGLNQLLSGMLGDKWTIGTDFRTRNATFNTMDMDVNISGHLFNDRLIINSTVGYHNNNTQMNNFTGDFSLEYKLNASGNLVLKAYNTTNNSYYEQATTTQGVGLVYKRQGRTLKKLFGKLK